jgi:hypothetical protein
MFDALLDPYFDLLPTSRLCRCCRRRFGRDNRRDRREGWRKTVGAAVDLVTPDKSEKEKEKPKGK